MKKSIFILITLALISFSCNNQWKNIYEKESKAASDIRADDFVYWSTLDGMIKDKFPKEVAEYILTNGNSFFVGKCPICRPTENAIADYIKKAPDSNSTNLSAEIIQSIKGENKTEAQKSFSQILYRYSQEQFASLNLDDENKKRLQRELEADRKQGMGAKSQSFGTFCPSCDGACGIKQE